MNNSLDQLSVPHNETNLQRSEIKFPVVAIGASAGGVAALINFFENMPDSNGMAFVVVLHLSPKHDSTIDQVLQRVTGMPVTQVTATTAIEKEHVYVIAPQKQLSMNDGQLVVTPLERARGQHTAIDILFRTLADVHRERAIAIVLSGTGADGAVGISRVKEQGGVTLAQLAADAEHDGMPLAAIGTGVVDFVLPVVEMPQKLSDLWENARQIELPPLRDGEEMDVLRPAPNEAADAEEALQQIIALLCAHTGHDFHHYKRATVLRRIERRMQVRAVRTLPDYRRVLDGDPVENAALLKDMLIGVTNFFRDSESFSTLERDVLPDLFKGIAPGEQVRAWVAACSTGEEAYSVAMLLAEQAALVEPVPSIQVFASDVDEHAISVARGGVYPASIGTDVTPARLRQFFSKDGERYRIHKSVRDSILFASHNLLRDPPFSKLDFISCRNLLIYLSKDIQIRLLEMFHFALKPGGVLFLGSSESADAVSEHFIAVDKKARIYRARPFSRSMRLVPPLAQTPRIDRRSLSMLERPSSKQSYSYADVHQRALAQVAPPSVIVDAKNNIVHMSENAGGFFRFVGGEPMRNVLTLVIPELRQQLRSALFHAQKSDNIGVAHEAVIARPDGERLVVIKVSPVASDTAAEKMTLVLFEDRDVHIATSTLPAPGGRDDNVLLELEAELQRNREQLQETVEHAEVSTEELRASNEELQAINEELRSATEELETSKEELQSVNEELVTVNYELKAKVDETSKANDDLNNLIASTDIATIFVDRGAKIKRFTPRAVDIFSIIQTDIGRSLLDLTHRLDYVELADDITATFNTLQPCEREVRHNDGRYFIVRLLPYRTVDDKIEGAVMTFFDISARREAEERVRQGEERMQLVAESTKDYAIITTDLEGLITSWNKGAERVFGYVESEIIDHPIDVIFTPEDRAAGVPSDERERARIDGRAEDERWHLRKDGSRFFCSGVMTPLESDSLRGFAKIARDQTDRLKHDYQREAALNSEHINRTNAETASALKDEFLAIMSHELRHPLNMININVELLSRMPGISTSAACVKAVTVIRSSVVSQAKIIEDLLDMSRINTGKFSLQKSSVDFASLIQGIVDVAVADPASLDLHINVNGVGTPMLVDADNVRLEQIVLNLLSNSIKFTPRGGNIQISLSREDDLARLDVADNGKGISAEFLPHVFDMFGQNSAIVPRSTKAGLGIGLALVKQIAELHGGAVKATSAGANQGACFTVWIPLKATPERLASPSSDQRGEFLHGLRVLLVDDAADMLAMFGQLLELEGAVVWTATTAADGLAILLREDIRLLVSDLSMPDETGYEFIKKIRSVPKLASLPALALSGLGRTLDVERALEAGFSDHICKPLSMDDFYEKSYKVLTPTKR